MTEAPVEVHRPRRFSVWKLLSIIAFSLFVMLAAIFVWVSVAGNRRFAAMEKKLEEMVVEIEARDAARAPLRGPAVPGNAWDDYQLAIDEIRKISAGPGKLSEYLSRANKADRAKVEEILANHGVALDHLRRGASRATSRFPYRWKENSTPSFYWCQILPNLALYRARILAEEGKSREASDLILDTCQFGRDLGSNGPLISELIGISVVGNAFDELRDLIFSGALTTEDLAEVGQALDMLDVWFPPHAYTLLNEPVYAGYTFVQIESHPTENGGVPVLLRPFGGIRRLMFADTFETSRTFSRRYAALDGKPWGEAQIIAAELAAQAARLKNPFSRENAWYPQSSRAGRERRAQLRLLRVAAHYRATGEILELEDPFGAKLRTVESGGRLKIWSLGKNGGDDGGVGEWNPSKGLDIVLDVPR